MMAPKETITWPLYKCTFFELSHKEVHLHTSNLEKLHIAAHMKSKLQRQYFHVIVETLSLLSDNQSQQFETKLIFSAKQNEGYLKLTSSFSNSISGLLEKKITQFKSLNRAELKKNHYQVLSLFPHNKKNKIIRYAFDVSNKLRDSQFHIETQKNNSTHDYFSLTVKSKDFLETNEARVSIPSSPPPEIINSQSLKKWIRENTLFYSPLLAGHQEELEMHVENFTNITECTCFDMRRRTKTLSIFKRLISYAYEYDKQYPEIRFAVHNEIGMFLFSYEEENIEASAKRSNSMDSLSLKQKIKAGINNDDDITWLDLQERNNTNKENVVFSTIITTPSMPSLK